MADAIGTNTHTVFNYNSKYYKVERGDGHRRRSQRRDTRRIEADVMPNQSIHDGWNKVLNVMQGR